MGSNELASPLKEEQAQRRLTSSPAARTLRTCSTSRARELRAMRSGVSPAYGLEVRRLGSAPARSSASAPARRLGLISGERAACARGLLVQYKTRGWRATYLWADCCSPFGAGACSHLQQQAASSQPDGLRRRPLQAPWLGTNRCAVHARRIQLARAYPCLSLNTKSSQQNTHTRVSHSHVSSASNSAPAWMSTSVAS
jgi:hypothetical protein